MYRVLGLTRDPFGPPCEEELYWEDAGRAALREQAEELLRAGQGVWLRGTAGSGRRTLLSRVGEALALEGRAVAWCADTVPCAPGASDDLLTHIGTVTGAGIGGGDALSAVSAAGGVYSRLVDGFCRGGPVIVFLCADALGAEGEAELEILGELRLVGRPLAALGLWGEGAAPWQGLTELEMPALSPADVRRVLVHRAAACGRPDLLSSEALDRLSADPAKGLGHALALARVELARQVFGGGFTGIDPGMTGAETTPPTHVLDPSALNEVERLLDALGSPHAP
ncbi:MAG: hypothetical protein AB1578_09825 [Thermodesulfobacteriota bacterium]